MNKEEVITELEYMIQRGVSNNVQIVLLTLIGSLKNNQDEMFAHVAISFAKMARNMILGLDAPDN